MFEPNDQDQRDNNLEHGPDPERATDRSSSSPVAQSKSIADRTSRGSTADVYEEIQMNGDAEPSQRTLTKGRILNFPIRIVVKCCYLISAENGEWKLPSFGKSLRIFEIVSSFCTLKACRYRAFRFVLLRSTLIGSVNLCGGLTTTGR